MADERVIAYIDGYNLYYGLREESLASSRWLDLRGLSESLLWPEQRLVLVRYFTTRVKNDPGAARRQSIYIDALRARGGIEIDFGFFSSKTTACKGCGRRWSKSVEKKTDANIAVRLLNDAYDNRFDMALVISGDGDLSPAIEAVRYRNPEKRVLVATPPRRWSNPLKASASAVTRISPSKIRANRLPETVVTGDIALRAPRGWLPR